ncbi:GNAT family N-acetyltransferase [Oceanirhabdus sp. W0125-5]|uniref:GNAT family N-acetyltransferase n=1 Tax=Oceanirhabdus sp. W0125-5 TaxID=2999116 RepID=UPI0022F2DBC5|nr:GNAT family N-acetyltransferase [Oceanirhabdus sp. W0125-5]WBW98210.1 hypothetical protein OW730_05440 [Oceanirhabdus sp. W0125-5]
MGKINIVKVENKAQEKAFIKLPRIIYKDDDAYVPNFDFEALNTIRGKNNTIKESGPFEHILAYGDGKLLGRATVGINNDINQSKGIKEGYIALFECFNDKEVANEIFSYCIKWLKDRGIDRVLGPLSLPNGEDYRGVLIDNFQDPTLVMNTYNKPYYKELFENFGFKKYWDCYAYKYTVKDGLQERFGKLIPYAMKKYGFTVEPMDMNNIDKEVNDIKTIIDNAMPEEWMEFIPPDDNQINIIRKHLVKLIDPDLVYMARDEKGEPIGFNLALPDYNQPLKEINGRVLPFGLIKFLLRRKKINRMRLFVLFVIPEYRKKGVAGAIYYNCFKACERKGYDYAEGSTIWEYNDVMMRDVVKAGAKKYKTYRIYEMNF